MRPVQGDIVQRGLDIQGINKHEMFGHDMCIAVIISTSMIKIIQRESHLYMWRCSMASKDSKPKFPGFHFYLPLRQTLK